jgi:hypothetical protein
VSWPELWLNPNGLVGLSSVMRRLLIIFLLMVVPFQLSWGAAAVYCKHENNPAVSHFGHHVHKHAASGEESKSSPAKVQIGADDDCPLCQLAGIGIAPVPESSQSLALTSFNAEAELKPLRASLHPSPPERPQWQRAVS